VWERDSSRRLRPRRHCNKSRTICACSQLAPSLTVADDSAGGMGGSGNCTALAWRSEFGARTLADLTPSVLQHPQHCVSLPVPTPKDTGTKSIVRAAPPSGDGETVLRSEGDVVLCSSPLWLSALCEFAENDAEDAVDVGRLSCGDFCRLCGPMCTHVELSPLPCLASAPLSLLIVVVLVVFVVLILPLPLQVFSPVTVATTAGGGNGMRRCSNTTVFVDDARGATSAACPPKVRLIVQAFAIQVPSRFGSACTVDVVGVAADGWVRLSGDSGMSRRV
jgi:hypothetical protein